MGTSLVPLQAVHGVLRDGAMMVVAKRFVGNLVNIDSRRAILLKIKLNWNPIDVYPWTGQNRNVQSLETMDSHLILGGGGVDKDVLVTDHYDNVDKKEDDDGSALVLEPTLEWGTAQASITFGNPPLIANNTSTVFEIANIEVWTMTPVQQVSQAMQLEMGRHFIFDHGNFVEQ